MNLFKGFFKGGGKGLPPLRGPHDFHLQIGDEWVAAIQLTNWYFFM